MSNGAMSPDGKRRRLSADEGFVRKRILITGGAGFIGSHLVGRLLKEGHDVLCVDSFFSGDKENVIKHIGNPRFELIRHDVTDNLTVEVDQIYHMACPASPVHYQYNAIKTIKTNVLGTMNMCGLAKRTGARLLQASTSECYGDPEIHPQKEDYNGNVSCTGTRACYDEGKRVAETLCMDYHRQHGVEVRIARIFNTYGPHMKFNDGRVVSNFVVQALKDQDITVYGDGSQTRSFCYVDDLVEGLIRLMNNEETIGPVNLGNPREFTIKELAEMVIKQVNPKLKVVYRTLPSDDPTKRQPDITRAKKYLNDWEPKVPLETGLMKTVEDFRARAEKNPKSLFCVHQKEAKVVQRVNSAASFTT